MVVVAGQQLCEIAANGHTVVVKDAPPLRPGNVSRPAATQPEGAEMALSHEDAKQVIAEDAELQRHRTEEILRGEEPKRRSPVEQSSRMVEAVALLAAEQRARDQAILLGRQVEIAPGHYKPMGDCTAEDLLAASALLRKRAEALSDR
jgi:hypothetical protein